jgi:hypothetical protein
MADLKERLAKIVSSAPKTETMGTSGNQVSGIKRVHDDNQFLDAQANI